MPFTNDEQYTEEELYDILDVPHHVTDRELEAVIHDRIKKFRHSKELYTFFNNVYDFFFEPAAPLPPLPPLIEGMEAGKGKDAGKDAAKPALVSAVTYSKDNLNPLLNQSIKRIISIDSQYRDPNYPYSTQFTFDLNDPLKDVVSLKLYSVQIPYTWYTINKDYGSNFVLLQGISPGINTGIKDYYIDISAGNYTPANLIAALNTSITSLQTANPDVNFGDTQFTYNTNTALAQLKVDFSTSFSEPSYEIAFPPLSPYGDSLAIYLGFLPPYALPANETILYLDEITTNAIQTTPNDDALNAIYAIDASNAVFQIIQYEPTIVAGSGANAFTTTAYNDPASQVLYTLSLTLPLSPGLYTRNTLIETLNTLLQSTAALYNASFTKTYIGRAPGDNKYNLTMNVRPNPQVIQTTVNNKIVVVFPEETATPAIWTGANSCFQFSQTINELCEIIAPYPLKQTNYVITQSPWIQLQCDLSGYDNSFNNFIIQVANAPDTINGYSLNDYLQAINTGFHQASVASGGALVDISGIVLDASSVPQLLVDINILYTTPQYHLNFTNSIMRTNYDCSFNTTDLSGSLQQQSTFLGYLKIANQYNVPKNCPVFTITGGTAALASIDAYAVLFLAENYDSSSNEYWIYYDHKSIATDINTSIQSFQELTAAGGSYPLAGTTVAYTSAVVNQAFELNLTVSVQKVINQTQYTMYLYDASGGGGTTSWEEFLFFNGSPYILSTAPLQGASSVIKSSSSVQNNSITLVQNSNDFLFVRPLPGVVGLTTTVLSPDTTPYFSPTGFKVGYAYNDIRINLPDTTYYTYLQLINALNTALTNNPYTKGSYVSALSQNNNQYIKIRWNINKVFTAADYNLVIYNTTSFVKCYVGDTSVRNTTWDTTLGWILGFQASQEYKLSSYLDASGAAVVVGNVCVNVNLYNYLLISLDDYKQNRINDGVITITQSEQNLPLPPYASRAVYSCDSSGNAVVNPSQTTAANQLTLNQLYSVQQILVGQQNVVQKYTTGPFVRDIFGVLPLKISGMQPGQIYVEFGGTLQQQERQYFGPVNINRMSITLYTDKGTVLDLNGTNWSFSFVAETLYQKQKL